MLRDVQVQDLGRDELNVATLARLQRALSRSTFVAIDTEMGGVSCRDSPRPSVMDSIDERYAQYRESAKQFPLVQFGLAIFSWDPASLRFHVETYQFPLFPVFHEKLFTGPTGRALTCPDRRFLVQAKCLQYIRAHGFDLNAWIDRGIGHLSHDELQHEPWKTALETSARPEILNKFDPAEPALITDETQNFLDQVTHKLKQRLAAFEEGQKENEGRKSVETMQDPGSRRRGRRGGKKNKKKPTGRTKRRIVDPGDRDRLTPSPSVLNSDFSGKDEVRNQDQELQDAMKEEEDEDTVDDDDQRQEELQEDEEKEQCEPDADADADTDPVASMKEFLLTPVSVDPTCGPCGTYVTEPLAPFRRHALVQYLGKVFPDVLALDCKVDNGEDGDGMRNNPWRRRVRLVAPRSRDQKQALVVADHELADDERSERNLRLVGFTAVFDAIVAARKPLVGHNLLLDLMQCFEKFHRPLPDRCAEFQRELHAWLGKDSSVFDTKALVDYAMQHVDSFGTHLVHSTLETCYQVVSKHPFYGPDVQSVQSSVEIVPDKEETRSPAPLQAHQAGYDAFMTGFVFLRVCSGLGVSNEDIVSLGKASQWLDHSPRTTNKALERFRNALFVSHFLPTYVLELPGPYPEPTLTPSRSRFVRMKLSRTRVAPPGPAAAVGGTSPVLKTFHIKHCVGWALNLESATRLINVYWEGPECVYVELPSVEAAEQLVAVRQETKECWGSANDPMPSIGCVDVARCAATRASNWAELEATATKLAPLSLSHNNNNHHSSDDEKTRRKRKSCEMA